MAPAASCQHADAEGTGGRKGSEMLSSSCQVGEGKKYQLALDYLVHCSVCFPLLCCMPCITTAFHPKSLLQDTASPNLLLRGDTIHQEYVFPYRRHHADLRQHVLLITG